MQNDAEYKKIYIQESDDFLQEMNKNLLVLEKDQNNIDALNAIFRAAHTLKSMSASMGYEKIAELSHRMEDLLALLRSKAIQITDKTVEILFKSFDCLEKMVAKVREDKDINIDDDITPILSDLNKIFKKDENIKVKEQKNLKINIEENLEYGIPLNEFDEKAIARGKKEGFECYHLSITLEKNCVLKSVRAFMIFRNLHSIGEVIKSIPETKDLEDEKFDRGFECIFITKESESVIKNKVFEILEIESVNVKKIKIDENLAEKTIEKIALYEEVAKKESTEQMQFEQVRKVQSVRVDISQMDKLMNLVEELTISKLQLIDLGTKLENPDLKSIIEVLNRLTNDLQTEVMHARLVPVNQIFERFPRLVRDLAKKESKKINFTIAGGDIELDRSVLDEIGDPIIHLLRNSIDHGIEDSNTRMQKGKEEEGKIKLEARREKSHVLIEVSDDGSGIDLDKVKKKALKIGLVTEESIKTMSEEDILMLTTHPGFSTKENVSLVSGRGVGLDVVKQKTEILSGSISIKSIKDKGTTITMRLPITTVVLSALLVKVFDSVFAIPISNVLEIVVAQEKDIKTIQTNETLLHRSEVLPIIRLNDVLNKKDKMEIRNNNDKMSKLNIVIVESITKKFGIVVDKLVRQQDIVIKQLTKETKRIKGFAGATILGDGKVALVIDVGNLV